MYADSYYTVLLFVIKLSGVDTTSYKNYVKLLSVFNYYRITLFYNNI